MKATPQKSHRKYHTSVDLHSTKTLTSSCNIMVYIRVRPILSSEYQKEIAVSADKEVIYHSLKAAVVIILLFL